MKRILFVVLLIGLLAVAPQLSAQDDFSDEELALIDFVASAFGKIVASDSVYISGVQNLDQTTTAIGQTATQTLVQNMSGWVTFNDSVTEGMDMTLIQQVAQSAGNQSVAVEMSMDMRLIEDVLYMQFYDLSPEIGSFFPAGWINISEDGDTIPGFQMLNIGQLVNVTASTGLILPIVPETILTIEELDSEELDMGEARVFAIEFDPLNLIAHEDMRTALGIIEIPGLDMDDFMRQMMDGATYSLMAWVDAEAEVIVQLEVTMDVDLTITLMGQSMDLIQTVSNSFTYSDFNEEIEIELPELGGA